jgi:hypothetical protein
MARAGAYRVSNEEQYANKDAITLVPILAAFGAVIKGTCSCPGSLL